MNTCQTLALETAKSVIMEHSSKKRSNNKKSQYVKNFEFSKTLALETCTSCTSSSSPLSTDHGNSLCRCPSPASHYFVNQHHFIAHLISGFYVHSSHKNNGTANGATNSVRPTGVVQQGCSWSNGHPHLYTDEYDDEEAVMKHHC